MNSDSLNMVSRLGEGHMPRTFFLSEPQLKTTVLSDYYQATSKIFLYSFVFESYVLTFK